MGFFGRLATPVTNIREKGTCVHEGRRVLAHPTGQDVEGVDHTALSRDCKVRQSIQDAQPQALPFEKRVELVQHARRAVGEDLGGPALVRSL